MYLRGTGKQYDQYPIRISKRNIFPFMSAIQEYNDMNGQFGYPGSRFINWEPGDGGIYIKSYGIRNHKFSKSSHIFKSRSMNVEIHSGESYRFKTINEDRFRIVLMSNDFHTRQPYHITIPKEVMGLVKDALDEYNQTFNPPQCEYEE